MQLNHPIEVSADKTIIQCGKTVIILSLQREKPVVTTTTAPKIVEPMEILESPGTPSTTNEYDVDAKQLLNDSEKPKRKRGRSRRVEAPEFNTQVEESNNDSICDAVLEEAQVLDSKLLTQSKKIFKIIRPTNNNNLKQKVLIEAPEGEKAGRRKTKRRN